MVLNFNAVKLINFNFLMVSDLQNLCPSQEPGHIFYFFSESFYVSAFTFRSILNLEFLKGVG